MRFPREYRLTTQGDFRFVFSNPKISQDEYFRVLGRANKSEACRLGLAVSRKNCRKATGRNRLKRVIRESFRHHAEELAGGGGIDIIVLTTAKAASICNNTLTSSLETHWQQIKAGSNYLAGTDNRKNLNG